MGVRWLVNEGKSRGKEEKGKEKKTRENEMIIQVFGLRKIGNKT